LRGRGLKQNSQERIFFYLTQFYEYLVDEDLMATNPIPPFRRRYLRRYRKITAANAGRSSVSIRLPCC
jgi:site-specific recombinase XerD